MFPSISKLAQSSVGPVGQVVSGIDPAKLSDVLSKVTELLGDPEGKREALPGIKQLIANLRLDMSSGGGDAYKVFALNELEQKVEALCQTLSEPKGQFFSPGGAGVQGGEDQVEKMQKAQQRMAELQETLSHAVRTMHETAKAAISNIR